MNKFYSQTNIIIIFMGLTSNAFKKLTIKMR